METKNLSEIVAAEQFRQRWLREYVENGGEFFDRILNKQVTKETKK